MTTITNEDNMKLMARYPDGYFDLAIVDPPYGINAPEMQMGTHPTRKGDGYPATSTASKLRKGRLNSGGGTLKNRSLNSMCCNWDYQPPSKEYFQELFRVSRNQIIWGGNYFDLPPTRGIICWDKKQPWENFSQWEMAWTSFDRPALLCRLSNTGGNNYEAKIHPTQKPIRLYEWCLEKFAQPNNKILDTHLGSGSIGIACLNFGLELTTCELDPEYFLKAKKRILKHQAQPNIFSHANS